MIGDTIRDAIVADSNLYALVEDRVYPLVFPSNPTLPCITYRVISGYNVPDIVGEQVYVTRVQLDVWSYKYITTGAVKSEIMRLFSHYDGVVDGQRLIHVRVDLVFDTFEDNTKLHRAVIDLEIRHEGD